MSSFLLAAYSQENYHYLTIPIGLFGILGLLRYTTQSSTSLLTLCIFYLISLLPIVSKGVLVGTAFCCAIFVLLASALKLNFAYSLGLATFGWVFQYICVAQNISDPLTNKVIIN
jgi:hypothetical protein